MTRIINNCQNFIHLRLLISVSFMERKKRAAFVLEHGIINSNDL